MQAMEVYDKLSWKNKFNYLLSIANGLSKIHEKEFIHQDLHIGNILAFLIEFLKPI